MAGAGAFPKQTFAFLKAIKAHNEKAWFEVNRDLYEAGYVAPARAFVEALGPRLRKFAPEVQFEPRINGSVGRINRDIRFSKDKRPYKDHLDLWFWHGEKKGWNAPGFYLQISPKAVYLGTGMYGFTPEQLETFRQSIIHPRSGRSLLAAVAAVRKRGSYALGGKTRKIPPRGFETEPDRAEYLLHEGLYASAELPASAAAKPDFLEVCTKHFANTWPIGKWLLDEVVDG
jgi:uncharacterized protein (TIGR02453 family)